MIIEDMESFLPSEVARLVYGYLEEENCMTAAQAFLESSDHLQECLAVAKKGRKFNTRILGRNLIGLLDMLSEVTSLIKEYTIEVGWDSPSRNKLNDILRILQLDASLEKCSRSSSVNITSTSQGFDPPPIDGLGESIRKPDLHLPEPHQFGVNGINCSPSINQPFNNMNCHDVNQTTGSQPPTDPFAQLSSSNDKKQEMANVLMNMKTDTYEADPIGIAEMESATVCDEHYKLGVPALPDPLHQHHLHPVHQMHQQQQSPILVHMLGPPPPQQQPPPPQHQQHSGVPTAVYMAAVTHRPQHNPLHFQGGTMQPVVSCPTSVSTSHPPIWTNPQDVPVFRNLVPGPTGVDPLQQVVKTGKKRVRMGSGTVRPRVVPKLRPIAPKITRILDNGIEVQVVHTKETPLVDLAETIPSVAPSPPTRRSQRSRGGRNAAAAAAATNNSAAVSNIVNNASGTLPPEVGSSESANPLESGSLPPDDKSPPSPGKPPPSPIFIDIHSLDLKR